MKPPETRYAKSGELRIAYQVAGEGPFDLIYVPGFVSNLDLSWESPEYSAFFSRLARFARLILFDKRGTGLSDRLAGIAHLEARMDDLRAVMEAAGSTRASLFGISEGGPMSLLFAATYPERVQALILYGSYAHHPFMSQSDYLEERIAAIDKLWGTGQFWRNRFTPHVLPDAVLGWMARWERGSASPAGAIGLSRMNAEIDARHILSAVRVPTLVMHRSGDQAIPLKCGREIAEGIPSARLIELPGDNHIPFYEPAMIERLVGETQEFLTGSRSDAEIDRVLATVMFTDIVESTKRAAQLGDRSWRELLERHDGLVRQQLQRFRGQEVKSLGDGFLATFDGPARAVRCSTAIMDAVKTIGIEVRSGLHTGEIEPVGNDIRGIAVHIASRVANAAAASETLVSSTVRDLVAGSGIRFSDRGFQEFQGLSERVHLYSVAGT